MTTTWQNTWLPTNAWVRTAIVPALVFIALTADRSYLADFWHHLARGRAMVEEGRLIDHDLFTFTVAGRPFQDVNWLTQLAYYELYSWGGLDLVQLVNALALAVTLGWLMVLCVRKSGSLPVAAGVGILAFFGLWQVLTIRPQTCSLLLFVLLYDLLDRSESRPWLLLGAPVVLAFWANLHGAFPAGIMLIGCFGLAAAWQGWRAGRFFHHAGTWQLAGCLLASLAATLFNPYGWRIYQYVGLTSNTAALRRIDEWVPPTLDLWIGKAWLASLVLLAVLFTLSWLKRKQKPEARDVILIFCFLPLACGSVRMVAWWLLIVAPMVAVMTAALWPAVQGPTAGVRPSWDAAVVFGLIVLLTVLSLPWLQSWNPLLAARHAAPRLEDQLDQIHRALATRLPAGRIFSRFEWGEYLGWSYTPQYQIFMDGRIEIYPDRVWNDYAAVTQGFSQWQRVLDDYHVDVLLLDAPYHARTGLLGQVEQASDWQRVWAVGRAHVYLRRGSALGALASRER